jgi:hypothetical protein
MNPLSAAQLLILWEQGLNQPLLQKTFNLVAASCPEIDAEAAARLSIGERDARLLALREWMFGSRLVNMADCPSCSERVEWDTRIEDIRLQPVPSDGSAQEAREFSLEKDEFSVRFRLPTSVDISTVLENSGGRPDPAELPACCILDARCGGNICDIHDLPDGVLEAVNRRMEEEDPQADIRMALTCPGCSHQWEARFDIVNYLWTEIDRWAERILSDVHKLARAYGWPEGEILNMSPVRRRMYLGMVG